MFNINDTVMYGNAGVCQIVDIKPENFAGEQRVYYILKPVEGGNSTIHCPVENKFNTIRKILTKEEIYSIISEMPDAESEWIENDNERKDIYSTAIKSGDHRKIVLVIKALYNNKKNRADIGKKQHIIDEKMLKESENLLYGEFAYVLNIKKEEVVSFITNELEKAGSNA